MHRPGLTSRQIVYAMLSTSGGTFSTYMSRGGTAGWIVELGRGSVERGVGMSSASGGIDGS